ncbi:MAG: sugar phosphate isomerase/epimerase [Candidatus Lokiarchaeota archaeon]
MVKLVLNENSQKSLSVTEFLEYSQRFYGVELKFSKVKEFISNGKDLRDLEEIIENFNLKPMSIFRLNDFSLCPDSKYENIILPKLYLMLEYAYRLGCKLLIVNPSYEARDIPKWKIIRRTIKKLKEVSKIAYKEDIRIGFEYLSYPNSSIKNLEQAKSVLEPLQSIENLGYIIDTFHLAKSSEPFENLKEIKEFIYLIQISDLIYKNEKSEKNRLEIPEKHRLIPGSGDFDFDHFLKVIKRMHYFKPFSLELSKEKNIENLYFKYTKMFKDLKF